jgi:hypothetical protein
MTIQNTDLFLVNRNNDSYKLTANELSTWVGGGGGGDGDTYITNYSGASAWGTVAADATLQGGLNIASVTTSSTGNYTVTFQTPMPDANYSVVGSTNRASNNLFASYNQTASGFSYETISSDNAVRVNEPASFVVNSQNALPPKGGTGTDAWLTCSASGGLGASFNIASVTKAQSPNGQYQVTFTTPMPTADYSIQATQTTGYGFINVFNKTTTGFQVQCRNNVGTDTDISWQASVNATNATLPQTVTQEQIESAINNPGASAWGRGEADGTLLSGLNTSSVTRTEAGVYDVVFSTPMPDANYSVNVTVSSDNQRIPLARNQTPTGFTLELMQTSGARADADWSFTVFATNALPPTGGTGTDAWASVNDDGVIESSFNIASVTRTDTGQYDVVFTTPMPTAGYAISGASSNETNDSVARVFSYDFKTTTGFSIRIKDTTNDFSNNKFSFNVNATNATLPLTVTQEQIESAISNPGISAWADVLEDGTVQGALNTSSVTQTSTGVYDVVFSTPMPSADYAVSFSFEDGGNKAWGQVGNGSKTATGFTAEFFNYTGATAGGDWTYMIAATNALPLKGGTGTDSWGTVQSDGTLDASFNVASVTRTATGKYDVVFTTPMPTANYAVNATVFTDGTPPVGWGPITGVYDITTTGFSVNCVSADGDNIDRDFSFTVNATNAVLPQAFTEQEVQQVVDLAKSGVTNPGASAWGDVSNDGTLLNGLNVSSTSRTGTGEYAVTFATPMPNAEYAVTANQQEYSGTFISITNKTSTGFNYTASDGTGAKYDTFVAFQVFATNALPLTGGTGTDSWGSVQGDGTLGASFNVASVTRATTGRYDVVFTTPMPTDDYAVSGAGAENNGAGIFTTELRTATGFRVVMMNNAASIIDFPFAFQVNATNAVLPQSFTEAQIQSVLDFIAVANPAGVARSWGNIAADGSLVSSLNVASVTRQSNGVYAVVFTTPMPNGDYAVTGLGANNGNVTLEASNITAAGFTLTSFNSGGNANDYGAMFSVFSN